MDISNYKNLLNPRLPVQNTNQEYQSDRRDRVLRKVVQKSTQSRSLMHQYLSSDQFSALTIYLLQLVVVAVLATSDHSSNYMVLILSSKSNLFVNNDKK